MNIGALNRCVTHLSTACYILIAGFVGMRSSEILSMQVGAIKHFLIGETGVEQALTTYQLLEHPKVVGWAEGFGADWRCAAGRG